MPKQSAGLLMYRRQAGQLEVLLVHPGGPFWAGKDDGAWSIPKGELSEGEDPLETAKREFQEETGGTVSGDCLPLEPLKQPSGKIVHAWMVPGDMDLQDFRSNTFSLEWPKGSGKFQDFPEVDRAEWFTIDSARRKLLKGQVPFLDQLQVRIASDT